MTVVIDWLILREMTEEDHDALYAVLADSGSIPTFHLTKLLFHGCVVR